MLTKYYFVYETALKHIPSYEQGYYASDRRKVYLYSSKLIYVVVSKPFKKPPSTCYFSTVGELIEWRFPLYHFQLSAIGRFQGRKGGNCRRKKANESE